jgi:[ribosomal protein S5]-alanine N-acetyltransferase
VPPLVPPVVAPGTLRGRSQPVLSGGSGLVLRGWSPTDAAQVAAAFADPVVYRAEGTAPLSLAGAGEWVGAWHDRWHAETGAGWAVSGSGRRTAVLGQVSLRRLSLVRGEAACTVWVVPEARGAGLGARALEVLADWAFGGLGLERLWLVRPVGDEVAGATATRAGFRAEGTLRGACRVEEGRVDVHLHARLAVDGPPTSRVDAVVDAVPATGGAAAGAASPDPGGEPTPRTDAEVPERAAAPRQRRPRSSKRRR